MALRGTLTHRKTRRLAKILGIPVPCALGLMEALWHVTAEQQPDGAIGRMSNQDIADEMFWEEDADQLIGAFVESGLIDESQEHRLVIHDWTRHADQATKRKVARHGGKLVSQEQDVTSHRLAANSPPEPESRVQSQSPGSPQPPKGESPTRFRKPTQEEVKAYAETRGYPPSEALAFWDFYESKGWKVGRNPMKDWQAAWRNWERGKDKFSPNGKPAASEREYIQGVPTL